MRLCDDDSLAVDAQKSPTIGILMQVERSLLGTGREVLAISGNI